MRSALFVACMAAAIAEPQHNREWTDASGKHSLEAEFVEAKVTLRLPTGQTKTVDMRSLSDTDRQFIIEQLQKQDVLVDPQQQRPRPAYAFVGFAESPFDLSHERSDSEESSP